ncbi:HK97 gp10 family phage protein [Bacillus pretiosus]|uniref:HK97 gp10 family phage protein n=1 Tax=Bacillus pretiosus TaxID=2983392 RepID=A0ABT3EYP8_9BACI|nr:HK97 gp10 family phage protein [Bacillus pretiosus]MCW1241933.1 hypothetical protein [Bacillus pretiosus]
MSSFTFEIGDFSSNMKRIENGADTAGTKAMQDCVDDLARIASNIAPIDKSNLRKSHKKGVKKEGGNIVGEVSFSAYGRGNFNYAIAMHEWSYTPRQAGGFNGYAVGAKYLERPLKGESQKYLQWLGEGIQKGLK